MNIIEAEDLVKGLPDQALFQEAQFPSGRIPQYLAVSEVQRRQDMRQRFQAAQQGQQSSVKDQILQGGIGSTGMAPEMSSMPPMAPQMPPQGGPMPPQMPPQMPPPMGMAGGGIAPGGMVYMQEGRTIPKSPSRAEIQRILDKPIYLRTSEEDAILNSANIPFQGARQLGNILRDSSRGDTNLVPYDLGQRSAPGSRGEFSPEKISSNLDRSVLPSMDFNNAFFGSGASPTEAPRVANVSAVTAPSDAAPGRLNPNVSPGLPAADAAMRQQAGAGTNLRSILQSLLDPQTRSAEEQDLIDLRKQQMEQGLPAPIDLNQYIQSAQQRQQEAKDESRRMAIANTLMNLGTGLFAGDPAAGMQRATQAVTETLREGRKEAQAEGRMAEQLQLQVAQQNRQNVLDTMKFKSEAVGDIANIISGEKKTNRSDQLAAAQILITYETSLARERAENARQGRTDANALRAAETSALQQASQYLREHLERTGEEITDQDFATRVRSMTNFLNVGGGGSNASRFKQTVVSGGG